MELIKTTNIDFVKARKIGVWISGALLAMSIISLVARGGPKYGIDFAGGTLLQIRFEQPVKIEDVRAALSEVGYGKAAIQSFAGGNEVLIRVPQPEEGITGVPDLVKGTLKDSFPGNEMETRRQEEIGPKVGHELRRQGDEQHERQERNDSTAEVAARQAQGPVEQRCKAEHRRRVAPGQRATPRQGESQQKNPIRRGAHSRPQLVAGQSHRLQRPACTA